jgi:hypothetical protein
MSKPYYEIGTMEAEIDDAFERKWEEAYSQAIEDSNETDASVTREAINSVLAKK